MLSIIKNIELIIIQFIYTLQTPTLNRIMILFTKLGDHGTIWIIITLLLLLNKKTRKIGWIAVFSLIICSLIVNVGLKPLLQRQRPYNFLPDIRLLIEIPKDYSFPSGHTAASFTMIYVFYKNLKKYFWIVLAVGCLIAFSRLYLSVHFVSDVLIGGIIGLFSGFLGQILYEKFKK